MKKNWRNKLIVISVVIIFMYSFMGPRGELTQNLSVPIGVGCDLENEENGNISYGIPISVYIFQSPGNLLSDVYIGKAKSIGETREDRQTKSNKRFLLGLERVFVISENYAQYGTKNLIDILVNNPEINDKAKMVVYKGKSEDILKHKVTGYVSSAEFIDGLINSAKQFNFFPPQYTFMDMIVRVDAEGRNLVLPYIELKQDDIVLTGLAIFKKDKMIAKASIPEAKIINILRENNVNGILTIQNSAKEYINYYAKSKRKVKCYKKDGKLTFTIDVNMDGAIVSNELYKDFYSDPKIVKEFIKSMEGNIKKMCEDFINKAKCSYNVDVLELGRVAAAKYGRMTGTDWNKEICNSNIEINVKVSINTEGRGEY
jgi:Ger(x)C family germination protein